MPAAPRDPVRRLAEQQKRTLSDLEQRVAGRLDAAHHALVMQPLGPHIASFADRYSRKLQEVRAITGDPLAKVPSTWLLDAHGGGARALQRAAQIHVGAFGRHARDAVAGGMEDAGAQGGSDAQALLRTALAPISYLVDPNALITDPTAERITAGEKAVRDNAKLALLEREATDSHLGALFNGLDSDTADTLHRVLMYGLGHGENPRALVKDISEVLGVSRSRALTISRTEMLNSYRGSQLDNYRANSDVVDSWVWVANLGGACVMCTELNGEVFPLDEDMASHPSCGCTASPITKSWDDILGPLGIDTSDIEDTSLDVPSGDDWLAQQDAETQQRILGKAGYNAYVAGALDPADLVGRRDDGQFYQKSLKEIGIDANAWLGKGPNAGTAARVRLPDGSTSYVTQGPPTDETPQFNTAGRSRGWGGVDSLMRDLRNKG